MRFFDVFHKFWFRRYFLRIMYLRLFSYLIVNALKIFAVFDNFKFDKNPYVSIYVYFRNWLSMLENVSMFSIILSSTKICTYKGPFTHGASWQIFAKLILWKWRVNSFTNIGEHFCFELTEANTNAWRRLWSWLLCWQKCLPMFVNELTLTPQ